MPIVLYCLQGPVGLPPPSRAPPPLPPTRSSSHLAEPAPHSLPPIPTRNYDRDELLLGSTPSPRYPPPPGKKTALRVRGSFYL